MTDQPDPIQALNDRRRELLNEIMAIERMLMEYEQAKKSETVKEPMVPFNPQMDLRHYG